MWSVRLQLLRMSLWMCPVADLGHNSTTMLQPCRLYLVKTCNLLPLSSVKLIKSTSCWERALKLLERVCFWNIQKILSWRTAAFFSTNIFTASKPISSLFQQENELLIYNIKGLSILCAHKIKAFMKQRFLFKTSGEILLESFHLSHAVHFWWIADCI